MIKSIAGLFPYEGRGLLLLILDSGLTRALPKR